jgi:H+/Cl- antiporter ClcA
VVAVTMEQMIGHSERTMEIKPESSIPLWSLLLFLILGSHLEFLI